MTTSAEKPVKDLPPIHRWETGRVRESARNPRKIPEQAVHVVQESIRRFGWKQPLVVEADGTLIVGHTRHRAARALGLTHVPVIVADDLTPEEVQAYRIADNRAADFSSWDLPELAAQLAELEADFADVLALTDWDAVHDSYQELAGNTIDLPPEVANALDGTFVLTVHFSSKEEALDAQAKIMELPGVFDVRHDVI